jgi:hypothetical protein
MKKPTKQGYYNYLECVDYINQKYNCDIDKYGDKNNSFWDEINEWGDLVNGSTLTLYTDLYDDKEWAKEIVKMFMAEFGENQQVNFVVYW